MVSNRQILDVLEELAGSRALGQQPTRPPLHPFPARMPVEIAEHLIGELTTRQTLVLDPMSGSGTTLIAARQLGRPSIGYDRDPLAVLITQGNLSTLTAPRLGELETRILERARRNMASARSPLASVRSRMTRDDCTFIDYWFPRSSQRQLAALALAIHSEDRQAERTFAWVVFSSLVIAKSAGASFALDLPRSRPHKVTNKPVVLPFEAWVKRFRAAAKRLPFAGTRPKAPATVRLGDARELSLDDNSVGFVLTSPPYLDAIDYLRTNKFSLVWMGHGLDDLRELRGTMIGTERGLWTVDGLPVSVEARLSAALEADRDVALRRRYLSDLGQVLLEIGRVLEPGGIGILALGPCIIRSRRSDSADLIASLAARCGLRLVGSVSRDLRPGHRSLPPPGYTRSETLANRMRREVLVALKKAE
jgi:DNA modification methylase